MLMITIRKGANLFASIVVSRLIGLAIAKHSMVPKTLASARLQTIEIVSGSCSVTMRGPASTPNMGSPPSRTAIEPLVGTLKSSVGMRLPPSLADRKNVGQGKSVAVRFDLAGRSSIEQQTSQTSLTTKKQNTN